jgi:hypothetical protein
MSASSIAARGKANHGTDQSVGGIRPVGRSFPRAMQIMHGLFRRNHAAEIASRVGVNIRSAERWLAGTREMRAEELLNFILSDQGADFLAGLINGLPRSRRAIYWARLHRVAAAAVKREKIQKLQDEVDQLTLPVGPADASRGLRR